MSASLKLKWRYYIARRRREALVNACKDLEWARRFQAGFGGRQSEIRGLERRIDRLQRKLMESDLLRMYPLTMGTGLYVGLWVLGIVWIVFLTAAIISSY